MSERLDPAARRVRRRLIVVELSLATVALVLLFGALAIGLAGIGVYSSHGLPPR